MKADELTRATWLVPWQAPEILQEEMVSAKSEVYALAAVIWELWSGEYGDISNCFLFYFFIS